MAEKTSQWPNIRINPDVKNRLAAILLRAKNGASLTTILDELMLEVLDQIESTAESLPLSKTVATLRAQLGHRSLQDWDSDLERRLAKVERTLRLSEDQPEEQSSRAAESPASLKRKRK